MTRLGKKEERKGRCPKKRRYNLSKKTGPLKQPPFKEQTNALESNCAFIGKIK